jgi:conjugal transfer pilus assembly protein TraL
MQTDTYIPRRLDDQWKIGFWDFDVALPTIFALFLGYLSSSKAGFAICVAAGLYLSRALARVKADKHPALALHWAYWHLPPSPLTSLRSTPPSHVRRMVG